MKSNQSDELALFTAALAMPAAERPGFVATACTGDPRLQQSVEELLRAHDSSEGFLDAPLVSSSQPPASPVPPLEIKPGDWIGNYRIAQKIGEGGCGAVYLAEQREPVRREVALKVIKPGMDTQAVIARFEAEREALSRMDHPNIARVLDAGATASGRPFFVMELVRGIAITDYCDLHRLATAQRLRLFIRVCRAVEHAHQKGVIHRDLKPSNILVTLHDGMPVPKAIDFGVAKATQGRLADRTLFTAVEQFVGTPAYMSPEQAEGGGADVDTRADVYSLGVLLHELLTGGTPAAPALRRAGVEEIRRIIRAGGFAPPSVHIVQLDKNAALLVAQRRATTPALLAAQVRGDLDCIVAKAMEPDRARRYDTVSALATDLLRHLQNEPILARPPSAAYRFQKLVARHKAPVAATAVAALALALAAGISTWQYMQERRARERAVLAEKAEAAERVRAEEARAAAERSRSEAEAARQAAERSRLAAETDRRHAEQAKMQAESAQRAAQRAQGTAEEAQGRAEVSRQSALAAARELKTHLYAADLYAVQNLLGQNGDPALVQRILRAHLPRHDEEDLRGVEWRYAWQLSQGDKQYSWRTEQGVVRDLVFSGNGRFLASAGRGVAGEQGQVRIWEAATLRLLASFVDTECAAFTPDSRRLVTVTRDGRVHLWRSGVWALDGEFALADVEPIPNQRLELAVAPLGSLLAICADGVSGQRKGTVHVFDWRARQPVARLEDAGARFAFSHDGRTLVTGSSREGFIKIWDAESGALRHQLGPVGFVTGLAVSPDGARLAAVSGGRNGTLRLWNLATRRLERALPAVELELLPGAVAFSPDGELIASGGADRIVRVWRTENGRPVGEWKGSAGGIWALAFAPQSERLFSGGRTEHISVWSAAIPPKENEMTVTTLAPRLRELDDVALLFAPNGKRVAAAEWERLIVSDTQSGRIVARRGGYHRPLWFSADGAQLLVLNQRHRLGAREGTIAGEAALETLDLLRAADLSVLRSVPLAASEGVAVAAASPDGEHVALRWHGRPGVFVYAAATGAEVRTIAPQSMGTLLAFSPDGRMLAIDGSSGFLEVWPLGAGEMPWVVAAHKSALTQIAFSADGRTLATAAADRTHAFWSVDEHRELGRMGGFDPLAQVSFSPDGKTFWAATGSALKVWHVPTQRELGAFPLQGRPSRFAFSPDERTLAYCDEDEPERRFVLVRIAAEAELDAQLATGDDASTALRVRVPDARSGFAGGAEVETAEAETAKP